MTICYSRGFSDAASLIDRIWFARTLCSFSVTPLGHRTSIVSALVALPRPKVQAEITLRNVAAAASNFLGLLVAVRADGASSADGIAIRTCASQFQ